MQQTSNNIGFEEYVSQVLSHLRLRLLIILNQELDLYLIHLRDKIIGNRRYKRGADFKRWGYMLRKYISTSLGRLEQVRIPRIRSALSEISIFIECYRHFSRVLVDQIILAKNFEMSGRKLSLWLVEWICQRFNYLSDFMQVDRLNSCRYSGAPLNEPIVDLIVDGVSGKFRQLGRRIILVAFGVTPCDSIRL